MAANLFSDVFKFVGSTINQAITPDNLKDYRHASKLFVDDQYRLVPKNGFLYHVFFDIDPQVSRPDPGNPKRDSELGMLVKSVSLPKFTVDTKKYNAYNRPNWVQNKISYDTLNIAFHDDSADVVRNFWFDYFNYYYRDSDYQESTYQTEHKYKSTRPTDKWGYTPRNNSVKPYLRAIRIYSLNRKRFSEYRLINPLIKSFRHGEHQSGSQDTIAHDMQVDYESVLYFSGRTSPETVKGFADLHYDKTPSPLTPAGGGTKSILGPGGILETSDEALRNLAEGNYGAAVFLGAKAIKTATSMDLKKAAIGEALEIGKGVLRGNNPETRIFVPSLPSIQSDIATVGSKLSMSGITQGISGPSTWLAGAAGLNFARTANSGRSVSEPTDAASFRSGTTPATAKTQLPIDTAAAVASVQAMAVGNTEPKAISQTDVNGRGELYRLQQKLIAQNRLSVNLQTTVAETSKQKQLTLDSIAVLETKRDSLLQDPITNQILIKDLEKQIADRRIRVDQLDYETATNTDKIQRNKEEIEFTEMRIKSLQ